MLIEQEVKLVKGRTSYLPVRLLIQVTKRNRIGKQLIEAFGHFQSHGFFELERKQVIDRAVCLNFWSVLVKPWLGTEQRLIVSFLHD